MFSGSQEVHRKGLVPTLVVTAPSRKLCEPRHAPYRSGSLANGSFLPAPSLTRCGRRQSGIRLREGRCFVARAELYEACGGESFWPSQPRRHSPVSVAASPCRLRRRRISFLFFATASPILSLTALLMLSQRRSPRDRSAKSKPNAIPTHKPRQPTQIPGRPTIQPSGKESRQRFEFR